MKASLLCALAKIRRKKIPNLFLAICIMATAALCVNMFLLLNELDTVFDRAYEGMEGTHLCCLWSSETIQADAVRQFLDGLHGKFRYQITEKTKTIDYIEKDGVKLSNGILLELPQTIDKDMLSPKIPGSTKNKMLEEDEIWVTAKLAKILGLNAGERISLRLADEAIEMTVGKIVADPAFGGSNTNVYRMWCGYGQLSRLPLADNDTVSYLEVRFPEYSPQAEQDFIHNAESYFKVPLGETLYTYDKIKSGYTAAWQMVGAVLFFVSAVLALAVAVLTLFLIKSDMDEDVRNIGIYKTLGMTGVQVSYVYLICYGVIGFTGAALGSVLGGWLSKGILTRILGDIGIYVTEPAGGTATRKNLLKIVSQWNAVSIPGMGKYEVFVWTAVFMAVLLLCFCAVFKVRRLNASYAIRKGIWQTGKKNRKERKCTPYHDRISFELYYALRGIQDKKARYVYIAGMSLILGCLMAVCTGCLNAVKNIDKDPEAWGFIRTDIYVTSLGSTPVSAMIRDLEKEPKVTYTYGVNKIYSEYEPPGKKSRQSIVTELYGLPWNAKIKDRSLYGRRPQKEDEISVGLALADAYGLEIGEKLALSVNGEKKEFEITGIFQTLSNSGKVIRMVTKDLDQSVGNGSYGDYMLVLTDGTDKWEYAEELTGKYGGEFTFLASKSNGENISGTLAPAIGTILTALLGVSILITVNLTFLLVRRENRLIGSLKAVGMTGWQIGKIYVWRNCLSALAGNSFGLMIGTFIVPGLLTPYARKTGLTEFPFVNSFSGILIDFLLLPACMCLGTCIVVRAIHKISVKKLVNE